MPTIVPLVEDGGGLNREGEHPQELQNQPPIVGPVAREKEDTSKKNGEILTEREDLQTVEGTDVADMEGRKDVSDLRGAKDGSDFEESSEVHRTDGQEPQGTDGTVADTRSP